MCSTRLNVIEFVSSALFARAGHTEAARSVGGSLKELDAADSAMCLEFGHLLGT